MPHGDENTPVTPDRPHGALAAWRQLTAKADAFFGQVQRQHGEQMQCQPGCTACCQQDLSVLLLEAIVVTSALATLPAHERDAIAARAGDPGPPCAMLTAERCAIYDRRPLVCRTHGLPLQQREPDPQGNTATTVSVCDLNFVDAIPGGAIADGNLLTTALLAADALLRKQLGDLALSRISLRSLAREGRDALPSEAGNLG